MRSETHDLEPLEVLRRGRYLFASRGDVPHPRRVIDAALLIVAAAGLVIASMLATNEAQGELTAAEAIVALFGWLEPFWSLVYGAAWLFGWAIVVVSLAAGHRRLGRDLLLAVAVIGVGGGLLGLGVAGDWPDLAPPFFADAGAATPPSTSP